MNYEIIWCCREQYNANLWNLQYIIYFYSVVMTNNLSSQNKPLLRGARMENLGNLYIVRQGEQRNKEMKISACLTEQSFEKLAPYRITVVSEH